MSNVFTSFISYFLPAIADFLQSEPIIYFTSCFLLLIIIGIIRRLIYISR